MVEITTVESLPPNKNHRITVSPTRATLKILPGTSEAEWARLLDLTRRAQHVFFVEASPPFTVTLRAKVGLGTCKARFYDQGGTPRGTVFLADEQIHDDTK
jgi:hypothetical protein